MSVSATNKFQWDGRVISTLGDVAWALKCINLPVPSQEALVYLSSGEEKVKFKECLIKYATGTAEDYEKKYINGVVLCLSKETADALLKTDVKVDIPTLARIGISNGVAFSNAVKASVDPSDERCAVGRDYILNAISAANSAGEGVIANHPSVPLATKSIPPSLHAIAKPTADSVSTFRSVHVYGGSAALCFNAVMSRDNKHYGVIVDGAKQSVGQEWDWSDAIKIFLDHHDLPLLYKVLMGWANQAKFEGHGAQHDKTFEIERQEGKFFAKVIQKGKTARAIPIGPESAPSLLFLVYRQIESELPEGLRGHPEVIQNMLRSTLTIRPVKESDL